MEQLVHAIIIGTVATAVMDVWGLLRKPLLGQPVPDYRFPGRWIGHMFRGRFMHEAIARSAPIARERLTGWIFHYLTGITFAAVMLRVWGQVWVLQPALAPALITGMASVAAPFLIMQPAMGAGFAASRTPRPAAARLQSLVTHAVFGVGLYLGGWAIALWY